METATETKAHPKGPETRKTKIIYTVAKDTGLYCGPVGTPEGQFRERANVSMKVTPLIKEKHQGNISFWVEVESPPERKGDRFWVTKISGQKGFLKT